MTALLSALDAALLHFVWQGVAVAMLLWITLAALRKRSANARYVASCAALGVLAVLPVVTVWSSYPSMAPTDGAAFKSAPFGMVAIAASVLPAPAQTNWIVAAQAWLLPLWACGVLLLSIRLLWGCTKVSSLKRQGEAAEPAVLATVERLAS